MFLSIQSRTFLKRNKNYSQLRINILYSTKIIFRYQHTESGKTDSKPNPTSLPQAAPVSREGINKPADTLRPYVQIERRK